MVHHGAAPTTLQAGKTKAITHSGTKSCSLAELIDISHIEEQLSSMLRRSTWILFSCALKSDALSHRNKNKQYLAVHCVPLSSQRHLRSAERNLLHVPRHQLNTYGRRVFVIAGPSAWNSLPDPVRNLNSTEAAFKRLLKILLFARY